MSSQLQLLALSDEETESKPRLRRKHYGSIALDKDRQLWVIKAPPHVMGRLKALFPRINKAQMGTVTLAQTPANAKDLLWFCHRFPMEMDSWTARVLRAGERAYDDRLEIVHETLQGRLKTRTYNLRLSPRPYQKQATELLLARKALLLADVMGLGKSGSAISAFTQPEFLPVLVVVKPNLMPQWEREIKKWIPDARIHSIQKTRVEPIPADTQVILTAYTRLKNWAETLAPLLRAVIFDEIQELRHTGTAKYSAARYICREIESNDGYRCGLSGSPIINYGDEMYSIMDLLESNSLGSIEEFRRERCVHWGQHYKVQDPAALGLQLRDEGLLLRRTREDVALELPPRTRMVESVDADLSLLKKNQSNALELARLIVEGKDFTTKGQAAREFDMKLRQITGIAKAPAVAAFARIFLEQGEPIIIFAWHREVYDILTTLLKEFNPVLYTGSESTAQKQKSIEAFTTGGSKVLLMSLRSSEGTDGLQGHCRTVIHAELDWSGEIHEQGFCRVYRPGQEQATLEIFLVSEEGSDPTIASINGVKRAQSEGVLNPEAKDSNEVSTDTGRVKQMALEYLKRCA